MGLTAMFMNELLKRRSVAVLLTVGALAQTAFAHETPTRADAMHWTWEPFVIIPLVLSAGLYLFGAWRMRARSRAAFSLGQATAFAAGLFSLAIALDSPIHLIGEQLFWVHMTQHEILMLVAAPLMVIGRPVVAFLWAFPQSLRERLGRAAKQRAFAAAWTFLTGAAAAWVIHAVALWAWHAPALFDAALESEPIHALQHICFLGSALLFWWTLINGRHGRLGYGAAIVYVFTTAAHNSILGALLTFARRPWYPSYAETAPLWSLTGLEDQQLGGLVMWVPAGVLLIVIGLALAVAWMGESQRRFEFTRTAELIRASNPEPASVSAAHGGSDAA